MPSVDALAARRSPHPLKRTTAALLLVVASAAACARAAHPQIARPAAGEAKLGAAATARVGGLKCPDKVLTLDATPAKSPRARLAPKQDESSRLWGYDAGDTSVVDPTFAFAGPFVGALARVQTVDTAGRSAWMFVGTAGTAAFDGRFAAAGDFAGGLAPVIGQLPEDARDVPFAIAFVDVHGACAGRFASRTAKKAGGDPKKTLAHVKLDADARETDGRLAIDAARDASGRVKMTINAYESQRELVYLPATNVDVESRKNEPYGSLHVADVPPTGRLDRVSDDGAESLSVARDKAGKLSHLTYQSKDDVYEIRPYGDGWTVVDHRVGM